MKSGRAFDLKTCRLSLSNVAMCMLLMQCALHAFEESRLQTAKRALAAYGVLAGRSSG